MWIHLVESFASIFFMNQSVDTQNKTWRWYVVEFKDVTKGVSYSLREKTNQIVFCDAAGHMLMFGNNSAGDIQPPRISGSNPTPWFSVPITADITVNGKYVKIKQVHGRYALTTEGDLLEWEDKTKNPLYLWKEAEIENVDLNLNYRRKIMLGSAPSTLKQDKNESYFSIDTANKQQSNPNINIIVTTEDIWVRSPACYAALEENMSSYFNYSCGFNPTQELKDADQYVPVERKLYAKYFKIKDIVKVEMETANLVVYTKLGKVFMFGQNRGQMCQKLDSKLIHQVGKFFRRVITFDVLVEDPLDPSIHVRTMKSYIFSKKQLRRCSGGSEIVDVQNSEAFTNKMNIKDV